MWPTWVKLAAPSVLCQSHFVPAEAERSKAAEKSCSLPGSSPCWALSIPIPKASSDQCWFRPFPELLNVFSADLPAGQEWDLTHSQSLGAPGRAQRQQPQERLPECLRALTNQSHADYRVLQSFLCRDDAGRFSKGPGCQALDGGCDIEARDPAIFS